jgi:hypothetical protein
MHTTAISAPTKASSTLTPWMAMFALSILPLFTLQFSMAVSLQIVGALSLAMIALAHITDDNNFDGTRRLIKLISPVQFAFVIWLSVMLGREMGGASFAASYIASIGCLFGIVVIDALASLAALLVAGSCRSLSGLSLATLIGAKYAGLFGEVK